MEGKDNGTIIKDAKQCPNCRNWVDEEYTQCPMCGNQFGPQ